jgi:hypothetical protein
MPHEVMMILAAGSLVLVTGATFGLILRVSGAPGWRIAGGVAAGLLLGSNVLGAAWPEVHQALFVGATEERAALERLESRQQADRMALLRAGATAPNPEALAELEQRHGEERLELMATYRAAVDRDAAPRRWLVAALATLVLLGAGMIRGPSATDLHGPVAPLSIGAWAAGLPAAGAIWAVGWGWGYGRDVALLTAAAVAIGPWVLREGDRRVADDAELGGSSLLEQAGFISTVIAIVCAVLAAIMLDGPFVREAAVWCLAAAPIGWLLPRMNQTGAIREAFDVAIIPSLAAWTTLTLELPGDLSLWPIVILLIIAGDVRWLGALAGALLPGRRTGLRSMRLVLGSMACGPTQLAVTALGAWWLDLPGRLAAALIFAALLIELLSPVRARMGERLARTEAELDELHDQSE